MTGTTADEINALLAEHLESAERPDGSPRING
jgi:hypothetical protein